MLTDKPREARFDGGRRLVDVAAVEAEAGLEAQRVPRPQTGQLDTFVRLAEQRLGDGDRLVGRNRDLDAVFACTAAKKLRNKRVEARGRLRLLRTRVSASGDAAIVDAGHS